VRLCSWNILAPELLQYFWRGSYGLPVLPASDYEALTLTRCENLVAIIKELSPDILLLQETTATPQAALGGLCLADFLAGATGLRLAGVSFKGSAFRYGVPPREQARGGPGTSSMDSGVATLFNPATCRHLGQMARAEASGPSKVFPSGCGSPFSLDCFAALSSREEEQAGAAAAQAVSEPFLVANCHIRMQFPHIAAPLAELCSRLEGGPGGLVAGCGLAPAGPWARCVLAGDLNAGGSAAAADLAAALPPSAQLCDAFAAASPEPRDDHILLGPGLKLMGTLVGKARLLSMEGCPGMPSSEPTLWGVPETPYAVHADNTALLRSGGITSDHAFIAVEFEA
jgi:hypothetical protein